MERHGADLEGKSRQNERQAEQLAGGEAIRHGDSDPGKVGCSGKTISQAQTEQQNARGKSAEHKVLQARFRAPLVIAQEGGKDIGRKRVQLEADVERQKVRRRDHDAHAKRCKKHKDREFRTHGTGALEKARGHDQSSAGCGEDHQLGEARERVGAELAAKGNGVRTAGAGAYRRGDQCEGSTQNNSSQNGDESGTLVTGPCRHQQQSKARQ